MSRGQCGGIRYRAGIVDSIVGGDSGVGCKGKVGDQGDECADGDNGDGDGGDRSVELGREVTVSTFGGDCVKIAVSVRADHQICQPLHRSKLKISEKNR